MNNNKILKSLRLINYKNIDKVDLLNVFLVSYDDTEEALEEARKDERQNVIKDIEEEITHHQKACGCNKEECLQAIKEYVLKITKKGKHGK